MKPKIIDSAYLYVREDGSEVWHKPYKPDGPSLLVDRLCVTGGKRQRTYTRLVFREEDEAAHNPIIVKPRGSNWEIHKLQGHLVSWLRPDVDWPNGPASIVPGKREEIV